MKKQVLFVAQKMAVGGIPASMVNLLQYIEEKYSDEYDIDLFVFSNAAAMRKIPERVNVICGKKCLSLAATSFANVLKGKNPIDIFIRIMLMLYVRIIGSDAFYRRLFEKQRAIKKYDVAVSFFNDAPNNYFNQGTNLYVSDFVEADEKVAWIHNDPIKMGFNKEHCTAVYKKFHKIYCVSGAVKEKFDLLVPEYKDRTVVCYNKFPEKEVIQKSGEYVPFEDKRFSIVTVCRIDNTQKRIDEVVKLCKRLKDEGVSNFCWRIVGEGPDLKPDIKLARELEVLDVVEFTGVKRNPYPYVKKSDLFALYSAYEGFPMVVGEALILDTYILTTNYAAAKEQIKPDEGYIAASDEEFFVKLKEMILKHTGR